MKKTRLFVIAGLFTAGLAFGQSITVTAPNGGECWSRGDTQAITWTSSGCSGNVRINLVNAGGGVFGTIAVVPVTGGSYSWNVGQTNVGTAPAGDYRIGLYVPAQDVDDQSAAAFSIISPAVGLSIQTPSGGESWELGSTKKIQWLATNIPTNCRLVLLKDGAVKGTIRDSFAPGQGENIWNWVVGDYIGGPALAGSGYKLRMQLVDESFMAESAGTFTIIPKPIIFASLAKIEVMSIHLRPDLAVCLVWDGKRPYVQENKRIKVRVKNIGTGSAPATICSIYIEGHGTRSIPVPALASNTELIIYNEQFKWATCGHKTVRATVDPAGQITEANENNNQVSKSIKVIYLHEDRYVVTTDLCSNQN